MFTNVHFNIAIVIDLILFRFEIIIYWQCIGHMCNEKFNIEITQFGDQSLQLSQTFMFTHFLQFYI